MSDRERRVASAPVPSAPSARPRLPAPGQEHEGWELPVPETLPRPTYWPIVMAVGITFVFMGIVTSLAVSGFGLATAAVALAGWIGDLRSEGNGPHDREA